MMAMGQARKNVKSSDIENVNQGQILQKSLYHSKFYDRFLPYFHRNDGTVASNKNVISADLENVSQGHHLQKSLYLANYTTDFVQTITKVKLLGLKTKASHQLTLKVHIKITLLRVTYQLISNRSEQKF